MDKQRRFSPRNRSKKERGTCFGFCRRIKPQISRVHHRRRQSVLENPDYTVGTRRIGTFLDYTFATRTAVPQFISFSLHRDLSRSYIYERGRKHKKKGHGVIDLVLRDGDGGGPLRRGGGPARPRCRSSSTPWSAACAPASTGTTATPTRPLISPVPG